MKLFPFFYRGPLFPFREAAISGQRRSGVAFRWIPNFPLMFRRFRLLTTQSFDLFEKKYSDKTKIEKIYTKTVHFWFFSTYFIVALVKRVDFY